jgi:rhodanese-related sulfurtransferase
MLIRRTLILLALASVLSIMHGVILGKASWQDNRQAGISWTETYKFRGILWIDARAPEAYEAGHYSDALNLTEDNWERDLEAVLMRWYPEDTIVVYCDAGACESSRAIALRLRKELGVSAIYWLEEGWEFLQSEGLRR